MKNNPKSKSSFQSIFSLFTGALQATIDKIDQLDPTKKGKERVISALILLPIAVTAIYYSKELFLALATAVTILMTMEWCVMTVKMPDYRRWQLIGFFYILIPVSAVTILRLRNPDILLWMFSIIWATDIFAFFTGKNLGGPKLAPKISPNKTWSGLMGGVIASTVIGFLSSFMFASGNVLFFMMLSAILAVLEQVSDLIESKFKRTFGVKDSGDIIPGHGGILDRLDGMMLVAPIVLLISVISPGHFINVS